MGARETGVGNPNTFSGVECPHLIICAIGQVPQKPVQRSWTKWREVERM